FNKMRAQWYIRAAVAMMEISGRGHECLGRVKGATENKIVTTAARNWAVTIASHGQWLFVAEVELHERKHANACSDASSRDALMPVVVYRRRPVLCSLPD